MAAEKAVALVLRGTDWSETSRIATLWTREFGKLRVLAKGGRRLKSSFDNALDLLTLCGIVLLRKPSGGLDLLTEAQVIRRYSGLSARLSALYAAYYVAELLDSGTQENDPHPRLFDDALAVLEALDGTPTIRESLRVMRFELRFLDEVGFSPVLDACAGCGSTQLGGDREIFSAEAGGVVCGRCAGAHRDRLPMSAAGLSALKVLAAPGDEWERLEGNDAELRRILGQHVSRRLGRRPRMLTYLEQFVPTSGPGS